MPMTLDEFQNGALRTVNTSLGDRDRLLDVAAGLSEEASEVLGLVRKQVFQGRAVDKARFSEELGDVLWCVAVAAHSLGLTLEQVADANQAKLTARHPNGFDSRSMRTTDMWSRSELE